MSTRTIFNGSKDNYIDECYYRNDGRIGGLSSTCATYLLRITAGDILTYNETLSGTTNLLCNFYNSSLEFISSMPPTSYTITAPENAFYVGFNIAKANIKSLTITCDSSDDSYLNNPYYTGELLYSSDTDDGKTSGSYIKGETGEILSSEQTAVTSAIDLTNTSYIQILNEYTNQNAGVFFDESGNRISNLLGTNTDKAFISVPSNAKTLKCTFSESTTLQIYKYSLSDGSPSIALGETLSNGIYINSEKVSYYGKSLSSIIDYILSKVN